MQSKSFLVILIVIACTIGASQAVRCYQCSTLTDGDSCDDPFQSGTKVSNCTQCGKAKYKAMGVSIIARICEPIASGSNGCQSGNYNGVSADMCYCSGDLCNTSSHVTVSMVTSLCAGALLFVLKKLM